MKKLELTIVKEQSNLAITTVHGTIYNCDSNEYRFNAKVNNKSIIVKPRLNYKGSAATFILYIMNYLIDSGEHTLQLSLENFSISAQVSFKTEKRGALAKAVGKSLEKHSVPIVFDRPLDSTDFPYGDKDLFPWFDCEQALENIINISKSHGLNPCEEKALSSFVINGYAHLDKYLDDSLINQVNNEIDRLIENDNSLYVDGSGERIQHLHLKSKIIANIWTHPKVMRFLDAIFNDEAIPCQTLTFLHGSEQSLHQDVIHLTPFPQGYMCGVWIALEDISKDSGPLIFLPKSHKALPRIYTNTINHGKVENNDYSKIGSCSTELIDSYVKNSNLKYETYLPKKGSIFIWHENLLHGGIKRKNINLSRRSLVGHYFSRGSIAYYDTTGIPAILNEHQRWNFNP